MASGIAPGTSDLLAQAAKAGYSVNPNFSATSTTDAATAGATAGLTQTQITAEGEAAAEKALAEGYGKEAAAYQTAGEIAGQQAGLAKTAGEILSYQQQLELQKTLGTQASQVAAGGFASSGSAIDILKSSMQQGALANQLIDTQSLINQSGYLEQQAATAAEVAAAQAQQGAATSLSDMYTKQAAQAASELKDLKSGTTKLGTKSLGLGGNTVNFKVTGLSGFGGETETFKGETF